MKMTFCLNSLKVDILFQKSLEKSQDVAVHYRWDRGQIAGR